MNQDKTTKQPGPLHFIGAVLRLSISGMNLLQFDSTKTSTNTTGRYRYSLLVILTATEFGIVRSFVPLHYQNWEVVLEIGVGTALLSTQST